jgi:hypothetical protein
MRRRLILSAVLLLVLSLNLGAMSAQVPAAPARDHDGQPLSELIDLDKCHVVGAINENGNLLLECPPFPPADVPTDEPTATDTALPTETDTPVPPTDTETPTDTPTADPTGTATAAETSEPTQTDTPAPTTTATSSPTATRKPSRTPTASAAAPTETPTTLPSDTPTTTATFLPTVMVSETPAHPGVEIDPYPNAPLCASHNPTVFHALWNYAGCHYDHEHGVSPFTPAVAAAFPGFDLQALLGGVQIGHTNPSSPVENTDKHGGMKWNVELGLPCAVGFEDAEYGVSALAVQYHAFGNYAIELEARVHSTAVLARQCVPGSSDYGYAYLTAHQDYGQMLYGYQGMLMPFPNRPEPSYLTPLGPYWAWHCIFCGNKLDTRAAILAANGNVPTTVTSKGGQVVQQSLFNLLFRARDLYQVVDQRDQTHPFTSLWLCSSDGGVNYAALPGCRYNNSTTRVHEVRFIIPAEWDNLDGWDTDPEIGRVTVEGMVTAAGEPVGFCQPGAQCFTIKLDRWRPGHTGATLQADKLLQFTAVGLPERDVYFCGGVVCAETAPGAVASGWIGAGN